MRIGELAKITGLSRDTIRFYERHGLIASVPSLEASNDYRDYPDELVERLEMIIAARDSGMKVADLQILMKYMEGDGTDDFDVEGFMDDKIVELKQTIRQARKFLQMLEATKAAIARGPVEWQDDN